MTTRSFEKAVAEEEARLHVVHPTVEDVPSCMALFDTYLQCNMTSTQIRALYRYGTMSQCTEKWNDVKFCFSLKSLSPEERRTAWLRHRAEWWATRRVGRSSEDIWDVRTEPLPPPESHSTTTVS